MEITYVYDPEVKPIVELLKNMKHHTLFPIF